MAKDLAAWLNFPQWIVLDSGKVLCVFQVSVFQLSFFQKWLDS